MKIPCFVPIVTTATLIFLESRMASATPEPAPETPAQRADFLDVMLETSPRLAGSNVTVHIVDGLAVLSGSVMSIDDADFAIAAALATEGIAGVINRLEVTAEKQLSDEVVFAARQTLARSDLVDARHVTLTAGEDRVFLDGSVSDLAQRTLARELVSRVDGIPRIENRLHISFRGPRTDAALAGHLNLLIADEPLLDMLPLTVSVSGGVARVEGDVGSEDEVARLKRLCRIDGVEEVDVTDVSLDSTLRMEGMADISPTDDEVLATYERILESDSRVEPGAAEARLQDGVLILTGTASAEARDALADNARGLPGIRDVFNQIAIRPDHSISFLQP